MGKLRIVSGKTLSDHRDSDAICESEELRLFQIGDARYMALPLSKFPQIPQAVDGISMVTIMLCDRNQEISLQWVQQQVDEWLKIDDVFRIDFLAGMIFATSEYLDNDEISLFAESLKQTWGTSWCAILSITTHMPEVSSGPYVLWNAKICRVYRLFDDVNETFMVATKPQVAPGPFKNLHISGNFYRSLSVAVPSRISPGDSEKGPLHGLRFAVEDVFEIEGLRVTAGNRAFYHLSKPSLSTAPVLQKLIDAGANLIGTLKLGSLIAKEEPTESVDFHAPFNPRADGYQSAGSSSGGSGAAIAAYDWIDFTLGTDTTGSSRRPAMANGCFQIRLSHDMLSLECSIPSWPPFDSPAMFGRDIRKLEKWVSTWIGSEKESYDDLPMSLVYLRDFLPIQNKEQMQIIDSFIADVESTYGIDAQKVCIAEKWKANTPTEAQALSIDEYLKDVGVNSFCYGVYHWLEEFRAEYRRNFSREPYVNPVTRWRWDIAQTISGDQYDEALHRLAVYKKWFLEEILGVGKRNTILILPITNQTVEYREDPPGPQTAPKAFDSIWLAPILKAPEISLPVGELKYHSRLSQRDEYLPVVVSLLGRPGSDMALIDTARRVLVNSSRPTCVKIGSRMFV